MQRRTAVVILVIVLFMAVVAAAVASVAAEEAGGEQEPSLFPVSQAEGAWPNQDGENVYYDVAPHPHDGVNETLISPRGFNEMVVYYDRTFHALNLDLPQHFRAADWHPEGEYALVGSGQILGPETGIFRYEEDEMEPVYLDRGGDARDVAFNEDGEALAVSYRTTEDGEPLTNKVLYTEDGEEFEELETPDSSQLRAVDWSPEGDLAVIVGDNGTMYVYEDGEVRDDSEDTDALFRGVSWEGDSAVVVGAGGKDSIGLPDDGGVIYEWSPDRGAEISSETEDVLNDVASKPDGEYALVVGGFDAGAAVHRYDGNDTRAVDIEADRLWGVGWTNGQNAIIAGDEEIWRYSYSTSPEELPPTASFTVTPAEPTTEDTVALLGFGSTSGGSADRIERWKFDYGQENPAWSQSRYAEVRFPSPGEYNVSLTVEDDEGERSQTVNRTVTVTEAVGFGDTEDEADTDVDDEGDADDASPLPGFGAVVALIAVVTAAYLCRSHQET